MSTIIQSKIQSDARGQGGRGLVVAEFYYDDGRSEQVVFECLAGYEPQDMVDAMIAQRNSDKIVQEEYQREQILLGSALEKLDDFIVSINENTLTNAGFSIEEVAILKSEASS